jgi:hypothetical protein
MKRNILTTMVCAVAVVSLVMAPAAAQVRDERAVKVALVYNLTKYVEWSKTANALNICFSGEGGMGEMLQKVLEGKSSESRPIHLVLFPSDEELKKCNILYIVETSPKKVRATLDKVRTLNILTVGETEAFIHEGGMVGLLRTGEQVQIQINLEAARNAKLRISSRLLDLAVLVKLAPVARN